MLVASFVWAWNAAAQGPPASPPTTADPEPNSLLADAPDHISLTFPGPVDAEHATLRLLRAGGEEVPIHPVQGDDMAPERLSAWPTRMLVTGDYTVAWSVQLADGGKLLTGAYPFRIGAGVPAGAARL